MPILDITELERFVANVDHRQTIVFDQDPAALGLVFGHVMHRDGRLLDSEIDDLIQHLIRVEEQFCSAPQMARRTVLLNASIDVLASRLASRGWGIPDIHLLLRWSEEFIDFGRTVGATVVDTTGLSPTDVLAKVWQISEL